jgi:phosphoadenosine phosphosulfate reductase
MVEEKPDFSVEELNQRIKNETPEKVLEHAYEIYGDKMIMACSFGAEDVVLVDMYCRITDRPRIFYLDTDKHFEETNQTRDRLKQKYNIEFIQLKPALTLEEQAQHYRDNLWSTNPNLCCSIRKVEPLKRILSLNAAWVSGIRREQSITRANAQKVEWDEKFQLVKFNPLVEWNTEQVWQYIKSNGVPYNPLHDQNYPSIGCSVCTSPVKPGEDPRSGRWAGFNKTECGLHK